MSNGFGPPPPALFTRIVGAPSAWTAVATRASRSSSEVASQAVDDGGAAGTRDGGRDGLRGAAVQIADGDGGAGLGEPLCDAASDAGAGAGDDGDLAAEVEE